MTKNTQGSEWRDELTKLLRKTAPMGNVGAIDFFDLFLETLTKERQALLQKVREIVGDDVETPSEKTIKYIKENNPEELLKLIMWGNNAAHENALRAQLRTELAKLESEI